jgi:hypothetical protein
MTTTHICVHIEVSLEATRLHPTHFPMHICFEGAGLQPRHSPANKIRL